MAFKYINMLYVYVLAYGKKVQSDSDIKCSLT